MSFLAAYLFLEDKTYCKRGGFIPSVDFNPVEFGIPPNILEVTDVSYGVVNDIGITTGGTKYKVGDKLVFDNEARHFVNYVSDFNISKYPVNYYQYLQFIKNNWSK